ncbi:hypothetical protein EJB05_41271, partial [Eragrostis curvula]
MALVSHDGVGRGARRAAPASTLTPSSAASASTLIWSRPRLRRPCSRGIAGAFTSPPSSLALLDFLVETTTSTGEFQSNCFTGGRACGPARLPGVNGARGPASMKGAELSSPCRAAGAMDATTDRCVARVRCDASSRELARSRATTRAPTSSRTQPCAPAAASRRNPAASPRRSSSAPPRCVARSSSPKARHQLRTSCCYSSLHPPALPQPASLLPAAVVRVAAAAAEQQAGGDEDKETTAVRVRRARREETGRDGVGEGRIGSAVFG